METIPRKNKLGTDKFTAWSVQIRSFFWSLFSFIRTEHGDFLPKSSYSVRIQENTDQKTPYLDTFHAVIPSRQSSIFNIVTIFWLRSVRHNEAVRSSYWYCSLFNWYSLHSRLNSHYKAWSYKKKNHKKIKAYTKSF